MQAELTRQWRNLHRNDMCPYGLISELPAEHLLKHPLLNLPKKQLGALCNLLSGQSRLQLFQYRIGLRFTPMCTCLEEEKSTRHYLFNCADYVDERSETNPNTDDWYSMLEFIRVTELCGDTKPWSGSNPITPPL